MTTTESTVTDMELRDASAGDPRSGGNPAVEQINWFVHRGDYWAVGGLPGAGKSQLLATAAGLARPLRGSLRLFGQDTFELETDEMERLRSRVGMVFADGGRLFRHLTVAENVALPLAYHGDEEKGAEAELMVQQILEMTGLTDKADELPGKLDWNLRQRAALARALALKPEILFLDEPLRGLDHRQVRWWLDFLARLNAGQGAIGFKKMTLVVTTNELAAWKTHATRFGLINQRRWMFLGGRDELRANEEPVLLDLLAPDV